MLFQGQTYTIACVEETQEHGWATAALI